MKLSTRVNYAQTIFFANSSMLIGLGTSVRMFAYFVCAYVILMLLTTPDKLSERRAYLNSFRDTRIFAIIFAVLAMSITLTAGLSAWSFAMNSLSVFVGHSVAQLAFEWEERKVMNPILG